jgi:hypothetical protein
MSLNKVITSVNALANSVSIPDSELNKVVCIDTVNNRIGVKTANPEREIDISGMLKTNFIYINNQNNSTDYYDISYDKNYISFSRGIHVNEDLCSNTIKVNNLDVSGISSDLSINSKVDIVGDVNMDNSLNVKGNILLNGVVEHTSDDRFKHNEKLITNGLNIIRQLQPQIYQKTNTFKEADFRGTLNETYIIEAGLIAQEVVNINDLSFAVVLGNNTKPYYVRYNNIFVYGLAAIKELDNSVVKNTNDIVVLSNNINDISNNISSISNLNLGNLENLITNQNSLINALNVKITSLETRIRNLENK